MNYIINWKIELVLWLAVISFSSTAIHTQVCPWPPNQSSQDEDDEHPKTWMSCYFSILSLLKPSIRQIKNVNLIWLHSGRKQLTTQGQFDSTDSFPLRKNISLSSVFTLIQNLCICLPYGIDSAKFIILGLTEFLPHHYYNPNIIDLTQSSSFHSHVDPASEQLWKIMLLGDKNQ